MTNKNKKDLQSDASLLYTLTPVIFVFLWSTGFIGSRLSAPHAEPMSFLTWRFLIVAVLLAGFSVLMKAPWPRGETFIKAFIIGALMQGAYLGGVFWAIWKGMPAAVAALIVALQPLATAFLSKPMLGEVITGRHWIGVILGILGVSLVVSPNLAFTEGVTFATLAATIVSMLAISIGSIFQKQWLSDTDMRTANAVQFFGATLFTAVFALTMENFEIVWNGAVIFALAWLIIVLSFGALSLLYLMIRKGAVSKVSGLFFLVPGLTAIIAWIMFGETLNLVQIAGMLICSSGVWLITTFKTPSPTH